MTRALTLFATALLCSCQTTTTAPGAIEHVVLAWQKKPGDAADRAKLVDVTKQLKAGIPQLKHLSVGRVLPSDRPVVDDSFDVAFVMRFSSAADLKTYEQHPLHTQLVKDVIKPLTSKIVVHDFVTE
jgi:hypothetical protein